MGVRPLETRRSPAVIDLHIDELVLHGFKWNDRRCIGDAIEKELSRIIAERGLSSLGTYPMSVERLDAGTFKVVPGAKAQVVGEQLAKTLHRGLSQPSKASRVGKPLSQGRKS